MNTKESLGSPLAVVSPPVYGVLVFGGCPLAVVSQKWSLHFPPPNRRKILGVPSALPLYFTATALAKLAHQDAAHVETEGASEPQRAGRWLFLW